MLRKTLDGFIFVAPSKRKGKKYDVYKKNGDYITSFGARGYEHYKDKIGYYRSWNHGDENRRRLYYARHGRTLDQGSSKYFSNKYLW